MRMWEIRENMGGHERRGGEYEYGYEDGYKAAIKEMRNPRRMDEDEEDYPRHYNRMYR